MIDAEPMPLSLSLPSLFDQELTHAHDGLPSHSSDVPVCLTGLTQRGTRVKGKSALDPLSVSDHQWLRSANRSGGRASPLPSLQPIHDEDLVHSVSTMGTQKAPPGTSTATP